MIKTYPLGTVARRQMYARAMIVPGAIGVLLYDLLLVRQGFSYHAVIAFCIFAMIWILAALSSIHVGLSFGRSKGDVIEAVYGKVVTHHRDPFEYRIKDLAGGVEFIKVTEQFSSVSKSIFLPVYGNVLRFTVACDCFADLISQEYYVSFLRSNRQRKESFTMTTVIENRLTVFLHQSRMDMVHSLSDYDGEVGSAQWKETEEIFFEQKALEYFPAELRSWGIGVGKVRVTCELAPNIIV